MGVYIFFRMFFIIFLLHYMYDAASGGRAGRGHIILLFSKQFSYTYNTYRTTPPNYPLI